MKQGLLIGLLIGLVVGILIGVNSDAISRAAVYAIQDENRARAAEILGVEEDQVIHLRNGVNKFLGLRFVFEEGVEGGYSLFGTFGIYAVCPGCSVGGDLEDGEVLYDWWVNYPDEDFDHEGRLTIWIVRVGEEFYATSAPGWFNYTGDRN